MTLILSWPVLMCENLSFSEEKNPLVNVHLGHVYLFSYLVSHIIQLILYIVLLLLDFNTVFIKQPCNFTWF